MISGEGAPARAGDRIDFKVVLFSPVLCRVDLAFQVQALAESVQDA